MVPTSGQDGDPAALLQEAGMRRREEGQRLIGAGCGCVAMEDVLKDLAGEDVSLAELVSMHRQLVRDRFLRECPEHGGRYFATRRSIEAVARGCLAEEIALSEQRRRAN